MVDDPRFMSDMDRFRNAELIEPIVGEWVAQRTVEEATEALEKLKVPCSVVNTVDKLVNDPQVKAREMIHMADHPGLGEIPLPGVYIKLSRTPGSIRSLAPEIGEHNGEVYARLLSLKGDEIDQLRKKNII